MNFKTKITAGFLALLLLLLGLGGYAFYVVRQLETSSRSVLKANFYSVELGQRMLQCLDRLQAQADDARGRTGFEQALTREAGNITEPGEQALVDSLTASFAGLRLQPGAPAISQLRRQTHRMIRLNTAALRHKSQRINQTAARAGQYVLAISALAGLLALLLVLSVPEAAVAPLRKLTQSLAHATNHDFNATIPIESDDEFGRVGQAFNRMLVQLQDFRNSSTADLLTERNRVRSIVNGLDEGLVLLDENRRILLANPLACALLGLSERQLVNQLATDVSAHNELMRTLLAPLDAPRREQALADAPLLTITRHGEDAFYRLAIQDLVSFNEALDKMEFVGQMLTLRNVSDFKKLDQVKSNFLATVSHEFKTPLSSINLSLKLLADERVPADERQRLLGGVGRETQRLQRLVGELLDVARLDAGAGIQLHFAATALPAVVQYAAEVVQPQLDHRQLTLIQALPADLPTVLADVEKTAWVLINLLANAVRYSPVGAAITVRAARSGQFVQLTVHDFGPGIAAENHEKIFQRFAHLPDPSGYQGGSGLGLSIAREFIVAQGGQLWVESALGAGSAFHFTLPVA